MDFPENYRDHKANVNSISREPTTTMAKIHPRPGFWPGERCSLALRQSGNNPCYPGESKLWRMTSGFCTTWLSNLPFADVSVSYLFCSCLELKQVPAEWRSRLLRVSAPMGSLCPRSQAGRGTHQAPSPWADLVPAPIPCRMRLP